MPLATPIKPHFPYTGSTFTKKKVQEPRGTGLAAG